MNSSKVKYSGGKIVPHSDLRVGTTQEDKSIKGRARSKRGDNVKRIGTWNVRTLLQTGKLENLKMEMNRLQIDILGISEMRWPHSGDFWSGEYRVIYSGTEHGRTGTRGVGLVLNKTWGQKIKGYVQYSDRIILAKIDTKPKDTVIIQVYMPTTEEEDEEVERIYEELNSLVNEVKGEENLIILGDFNASVGEVSESYIVGKFGLGVRNTRGDTLIEFCTKHKLSITNTHFQHHKRRRYTWRAPGDTRRVQIDYILVRERFKNQVKDSRSYPGTDIDSDHNLVLMHCDLKFKKLTKKGKKSLQITNFRNKTIREMYREKTNEAIRECNIIQETNGVNNKWNNIKKCLLKTAEEVLGKRKTAARKEWITNNIVDMINERRKYKNATDQQGMEKYRSLRNSINRECKKSKEAFLDSICKEVNVQLKSGQMDKAYGTVKAFFGERRLKQACIKGKNGEILFEEWEIANRWKEYLEHLYSEEEDQDTQGNEDEEEEDRLSPEEEDEDRSIMKEEFEKALMELKDKKAPGVDEIPAEFIKNSGEIVKNTLYELVQRIYETGEMPQDFTKCVIVPIPKKARANKCEQYRTLSLLSHASKILTRIVLRRIETTVDSSLTEDQFGFRKQRGTREAILALRQVIEKQNRKSKPTIIAFVDLEKAFDNVKWKTLFQILKKSGMANSDRRIIKSLYKNERGVVRYGDSQEIAEIKKGVRQGCSLSPCLFNLYVQEAINRVRELTQVGIKIQGENVDMLRFADDIAVLTENEEDLQNILTVMNSIFREEYNMKINKAKTKILVCSRNEAARPNIKLDGEALKVVDEYKYLGSTITNDGRCVKEIKSRLQQARCAFQKKKNLLTSRNIDLKIRKNLLKTYVWSVALYGSETWTIRKAEEKNILAFEVWCYRRILKISWIDRISNEEVFRRVGEERSFLKALKIRRAKLIGHSLRHNNLLGRIIEGSIEGKNSRGRPPLEYIGQLVKDLGCVTYYELKRKAEKREEWRIAANQPLSC